MTRNSPPIKGIRLHRRDFLASIALGASGPAVVRSNAQAGGAGRLRAGAAVSNLTLPLGASNGGVIARGGPATDVRDDLFARCLVLDDGRARVALAVCDARMISREVVDKAKRYAFDAAGIPADYIMISATHTHSAPAVIGLDRVELDRWYLDFFARRVADGIRRASNRLAPARIGWGAGAQPQHVFNRRWHMKSGSIPPDPFGNSSDRVQMNPPAGSPNLVEPAGPVDPQVGVIGIRHEDGRPLALWANYGLHYVGGAAAGEVSADYYGIFADRVQQLLGADRQDPAFVAMLSNGSSGDVNNVDVRKPARGRASLSRMREVAYDVAAEAVRVCGNLEYRNTAGLAVRTRELQIEVRRPDAARLEWARRTLESAPQGKSPGRPQIYAEEAQHLAKFPAAVPVKLQVIRIGELALAAAPCEVFAETGLAIKRASPFNPTLLVELANGYNGYLPTRRQHELGGYETWPSRGAYLERDAETKIRAALLELLTAASSA